MSDVNGTCPVCDAQVSLPQDTEVSEIIACPECETRLVVEEAGNAGVVLTQAPEIEEDWGQ